MPTYAPDLVFVPSRTGVGVDVNIPNAGLYGRHYRPQPFLANGLVNPELWGNFTFGPAYLGLYYREQWYCENQNQPVVYTLVTGSLPPGLVLSNIGTTAEGQIDGTPTAVGTYNFTLRAQGPTNVGDKPFTIVVNTAPTGGGGAGWSGGG